MQKLIPLWSTPEQCKRKRCASLAKPDLPDGKTSQTTTTFDPGFSYSVYHTFDGSTTYLNGYYGTPVHQNFYDYGQGVQVAY